MWNSFIALFDQLNLLYFLHEVIFVQILHTAMWWKKGGGDIICEVELESTYWSNVSTEPTWRAIPPFGVVFIFVTRMYFSTLSTNFLYNFSLTQINCKGWTDRAAGSRKEEFKQETVRRASRDGASARPGQCQWGCWWKLILLADLTYHLVAVWEEEMKENEQRAEKAS